MTYTRTLTLAGIVASALLCAPAVSAEESTSFRVFPAFPGEAIQNTAISQGYQLNDGSIRWTAALGKSANFQLLPPTTTVAAPRPAAATVYTYYYYRPAAPPPPPPAPAPPAPVNSQTPPPGSGTNGTPATPGTTPIAPVKGSVVPAETGAPPTLLFPVKTIIPGPIDIRIKAPTTPVPTIPPAREAIIPLQKRIFALPPNPRAPTTAVPKAQVPATANPAVPAAGQMPSVTPGPSLRSSRTPPAPASPPVGVKSSPRERPSWFGDSLPFIKRIQRINDAMKNGNLSLWPGFPSWKRITGIINNMAIHGIPNRKTTVAALGASVLKTVDGAIDAASLSIILLCVILVALLHNYLRPQHSPPRKKRINARSTSASHGFSRRHHIHRKSHAQRRKRE